MLDAGDVAARGGPPRLPGERESPERITMRLDGKVAVVTGGSKGIGRAVALAFAGAGARVVVNYAHDAAAAEATVAAITAAGGQAVVVQGDVREADTAARLVAAALAAFGRLDIWMNNAGADILTGENRALPIEAKLRLLLEIDLMGTFFGSRAAAEAMRAGGGSIINVAWDHVWQGYPTDYGLLFGAAKGGVAGLSLSLARQAAPAVRVNVLAPGWIKTAWGSEGVGASLDAKVIGMTPLARWGTPDDLASAAVFLASDAASFITGQILAVNGGVVMG
jgi:3-oxoacyl-[acyl-carrier protein] reductase